jgi:hypothetical protein
MISPKPSLLLPKDETNGIQIPPFHLFRNESSSLEWNLPLQAMDIVARAYLIQNEDRRMCDLGKGMGGKILERQTLTNYSIVQYHYILFHFEVTLHKWE